MVELSDFYMREHEITVNQFWAFSEDTEREMPHTPSLNTYGI